jgi:hypothetical protein
VFFVFPPYSRFTVSCGFRAGRHNLLSAEGHEPIQARFRPLGSVSKSDQRSNKLVNLKLRRFETVLLSFQASFVAMLQPGCNGKIAIVNKFFGSSDFQGA